MDRKRASAADRAHFERVGAASAALPDDAPPRSLEEVFDRLDAIRRTLGAAARPGLAGEDASELEAHLRLRRRGREIEANGTQRPGGAR
jgi:hypothetical protein